jgi:hypothetical protein
MSEISRSRPIFAMRSKIATCQKGTHAPQQKLVTRRPDTRIRCDHRSSPRYLALNLRTAKASSRPIWRPRDASAFRDYRRPDCIPHRTGSSISWLNGCRGFFVSASGNEIASQKENVSGRSGGDGRLRSFWMVLRSSSLRKILESRFDPFGTYRNRGDYYWIPDFVDKTLGHLD